MLVLVANAAAAREAEYRVDIQSLFGNYLCGPCYLTRAEIPSNHREDIAVLALTAHPVFILVVANGHKVNVDMKLSRLEQQFLHHLAGSHLVDSHQYAQRQRGMDVGLADV